MTDYVLLTTTYELTLTTYLLLIAHLYQVLRHFSSHQNAPPFLAHRLIQRLVTSNPSPRYVSTVAHAFASGAYAHTASGASFGGRAYGDLGAAVAAILLDREARRCGTSRVAITYLVFCPCIYKP